MATFFNDFSADDFDAQADMWDEERDFREMMEEMAEEEDEISRKLAEFGLLDDIEFDEDEDWLDDEEEW